MTEEALLQKNAGLIYKFSLKFIRLRPEIADDILQAARLGFVTALRAHDPAKGALTTVATMYILREIALLFEIEHTIRLPRGYAAKIRKLRAKPAAELTQAERSQLYAATPAASLDVPVFGDESAAATRVDVIESDSPSPEAIAEQAELARALAAAINNLAPAQREVIGAYHGPDEQTFDEIGIARGNGKAAAHMAYKAGLKNLRRSLQHLAA